LISLVQITDLHLTENKKTKVKLWDTHSSFQRTVNYIKSNENPDFLVASGDISNDGTKKSYIAYQKGIERFEKPVFTILGNHDNRKNFQAVFQTKLPSIKKIILSETWLIIAIDSTSINRESGKITKQQIRSLRKLIEENKDKSLVLCLHHQPIKMGFWIDQIGLENSGQFIASIANQPNIKAVIWGHVHHESESRLESIKMLSTPSTCFQFCGNSENPDTDRPGYRKINLFKSGKLETKVVRID
jgi:Icc protein